MKKLLCALFGIALIPITANAACSPGYYGNECTRCPSGYYCPGDGEMYACPDDTTNWEWYLNEMGLKITSDIPPASIWSWNDDGGPGIIIRHCVAGFSVATNKGGVYIESKYNGTDYWSEKGLLWFDAYTGYYLSGYRFTSGAAWYFRIAPCTNAPEHAHYTGPGTPDAPDGSVRDANDCPWECDAGYGLHDDICVPLCATGISTINTAGGQKFNIYPVRYSTPAVAIKYNDKICYAVLAPGRKNGTINIKMPDNTIYHITN